MVHHHIASSAALLVVALSGNLAGQDTGGGLELRTLVDQVHAHLWHDIMPYWAQRSPDAACGGFLTHFNEAGEPAGPTQKFITMQARMVWAFSAAHRHGMQDRGYLAHAAQGFAFMREHMADREHGGYFPVVTREGAVLKDHKSVYQQSFVIYAFSEYYLASGDEQAVVAAEELFDVLERHARDGDLGYHENFQRDWSRKPAKEPERKTLDTHMHLMECFTTLFEASGKERHREALEQVMDLLLAKAIHPRDGYAYEPVDREWNPRTGRDGAMTTMYGHNVELAWLMLEAMRVLHRDREADRQAILGLIDHALAFGVDRERGGLALYGPQTGDVLAATHLREERLRKSWWEQAELLVALSEAYAWTREPRYFQALQQTWGWVWQYQIDHVHGEWYSSTDWTTGAPTMTSKGNDYKCAYHNGRALMMMEKRLRPLLE